jgi:hypothetical protein
MRYDDRERQADVEFRRRLAEKYGAESAQAQGLVYSLQDLLQFRPEVRPDDGDTWGPWRFHQDNLTLDLEGEAGTGYYEIDLERMEANRDLVDLLSHCAGKVWGTPEVLGHLFSAIQSLAGVGNLAYMNVTKRIRERYGQRP